MKFSYDVIVIGGGHAGCEAATASANMGAKTCLVTMDMNKIAQMSCNPAVGGIAKGQIVREIDALGGFMGIVTDNTSIQFRLLNISKGPAMWSPRAQCDREKYIWEWRKILDKTDNLDIWQDQAEEIIVDNDNNVLGINTLWGTEIYAKSIVLTAGTFLNGLMHIGRKKVSGGRIAEPAVGKLTESIARHGIRFSRMKTGTPVRIDKRSVDFSLMEPQEGDNDFHTFSYMSRKRSLPQLPCWTCYTNKECHDVLKEGMPLSPLYNGQIQSTGPRYCPSIETKLVTFPDRNQHPLFLEPEGSDTNEMYLNGFSSSMPIEIQIEALRKIPSFRNIRIYRPGYAIEYDYFDPTQLKHSLESKIISGLFFAGQVNGTTGYEEAGGQGIVAGINAALKCTGDKVFTMKRDESYIGVLIDDLVTKGVDEPYRMFTSRAEYRILLRQDNADLRLTPRAYEIGLASQHRYDMMREKYAKIDDLKEFCQNTNITTSQANPLLASKNSSPITESKKISDIAQRPELNLREILNYVPRGTFSKDYSDDILESVEISLKYSGYIDREIQMAEKLHRLENLKIPENFDFDKVSGLSIECRQKLKKYSPKTIAQASRISGVSPSDISVLLLYFGR